MFVGNTVCYNKNRDGGMEGVCFLLTSKAALAAKGALDHDVVL